MSRTFVRFRVGFKRGKTRQLPLDNRHRYRQLDDMSSNSSFESGGADDPRERFGRLVASVYRRWRRHVDVIFRAQGFTEATRAPLVALYDNLAPMRQKDLAARLGLEPSALVRVIETLRKRGLVSCTPDENDHRTKLISLTPEGNRCAIEILRRSIEIERQLLVDLTEEEKSVLRSALEKIADRIPDG